ncbi:MAG: YDG domain-containing protein [Chitinophagales bacterium]
MMNRIPTKQFFHILLFTSVALFSKAQLFQQQFGTAVSAFSNASMSSATYINASPSNSQFTSVTSTGASATISVASNKMTFARTGNGWSFVRGGAFSGPPGSLMIRFDYSNSASSGATTSAVVFGVGGGTSVTTTAASLTNADVHSRLAFNCTANATEFVVRDIAGSTNGATTFTGTQTVIMVINNSGAAMTYRAPDGTQESVADDKFDVWVGTSKQLDDRSATTTSQTLSYFKCFNSSGSNTVNFTNMLMDPIPAIPTSSAATSISSTGFTANWSTVSGVTGYRIDVATDAAFTSMVSGYNNLYVSGQSTSSLSVTGLSAGTPYYYRVRGAAQYTVGEFASGNSGTQNPTTLCAAPATQASLLTFTGVSTGGMTINWTNGSGAGRVVKMNSSNSFTAPTDGSNPSASTAWANAGEQVIYNGTGNSVSVTGLSASTTYYYRVYEYCTTGRTYQTATATDNPKSQATAGATTPVVTGGSPTGNVGAAFSYFISATNSPTSYAISSGTLPPGLSLNTTTGEISGTPTAVSTAAVDVTATNGSGTSAPATLNFTISKGTQSLSGLAGSDSKVYGASPYSLGATINSGLTLSYSSSNTGVATVSGGTVTIVGVGSTTITVSQAGDANWNALSPSGTQTLTVTEKALTVSGLTGSNKVYDGNNSASFTGSPSLVGVVGSDVVTLGGSPTATFANKNVGTAKPITVSGYTLGGAQAGNYTLTQPTLSGDISAKALTVTSPAVTSKSYDGTTAAIITGTLSGIVSPDVVTLNGTGTFASANAATGISVTSTSTLGGADAGNYSLTQPTGLTGDITPASQTITFGALATKTTADAPFSLTGTASSGLTVTYTSSDPTVATVSGSTVTIVGAGTTTITASQAGNSNYNAASNVPQTLTVTTAPVTLGTYPFTGTTCTNYVASGVVSNLTMADMTVTGITCNTNVATNIFGGNTSWGTSFNASKYVEITLTPASGYQLTVNSIALDVWRSSAGAQSFAIRSSLDSYAADLGSGSVTTTQTTNTITLSSTFQNLTSAVTFRIYGYGGNSTGDFRIDNITPSGNIFSSCTAPSGQPGSISTSSISDAGLNASFNRGTSAGSILVIRPTAQANAVPVVLTSYTANTSWTSAGQINTNNRVLANSTAAASSSVNVTGISGLSAETQYTLSAYEYSGTNCYNTTSPPTATFYTLSTEPTAQPTSGLSATTCTSNSMAVTVPAPSAGADGYLLIYKAGSAPTGLPSDAQSYTAGNTFGDATVGAIVTAAGTVTVTGLSASTAYYFQLVPYNSNAALTAATYNYLTSGSLLQTNFTTLSVSASTASRVGTSVTYGYTANINYLTYQSTPVPASSSQSQGVFQITIKDGDGTTDDADALPTLLNAISFSYSGTANTIRAAALFTPSNSKIADGTVGANSITFTGLTGSNVTASDHDSVKAILRVTFNTTVTDNQKLVYTVTSVTAGSSCSYSQFAAADGGGAVSDNNGGNNNNRLVVTATRIKFFQQPTSTSTGSTMSPSVTVRGVDVNGNVDLDYTGSIDVTSTGTMSSSPVTASAVSGVATFSITHTASGTGLVLYANTTGLTVNADTSATFDISSFAANSYRTVTSGTWTSATWERFVSGAWSSSSAPSTSTSNFVYIRHNITTSGAMSPANVVITSTGYLEIDHSSTIGTSLLVQKGGELLVNATATISGTFEVEDSAYVGLNFDFANPSTSIWAGTENFHPKSFLTINHWKIRTTSNMPLFDGDVTLNSYNGYSAAFGNVIISFSDITLSGTTSSNAVNDHWEMLGSGANGKNLCHGNLEFSDPIGFDVRFCATAATTIATGIGGNLYLSANWSSARSVFLGTSSATVTLNVKGHVIMDCPGDLVIRGGNSASGTCTLNVDSNLVMNGSNTTTNTNLKMNSTGYSTALGYQSAVINLKGNLLVGSNPTIFSGAPAADIHFNFTGSSVQDINVASVIGTTTNVSTQKGIPFEVKTGSSVRLKSNSLVINNGSSFTVDSAATLDFNWNDAGSAALILQQPSSSPLGTNTINTLQGCTLKITSPDGLIADAATYGTGVGNVQQIPTSNRSFNTVATFWYTGKTTQTTGDALGTASNGRIVICELIDNTVTLTPSISFGLTNNTVLSATGGKLDIRMGQFTETTTNYITGSTGTLYMSPGTVYKVAKGYSTLTTESGSSGGTYIPRMLGTTFAYVLNGGTIELAGAGSSNVFQTLRGSRTYKSVQFSGANSAYSYPTLTDYKNLSSGVVIDSALIISGGAIVDAIDNSGNTVSFTGTGGLVMSGSGSRLRMKALNTTLPELTATSTSPSRSYSLTGGTVELYGTNASQNQSLRGTANGNTVNYFNVDIKALGANVSAGGYNVNAQAGFNVQGTMNVDSPACFQLASTFTVSGSGSFNIKSGATFKYGGTINTDSTGNVRCSTKTYSTGASYGFVGSQNPQTTGTALPASMVNMYLDKNSASDLVSLSNAAEVKSNLTFQSHGIISTGSNTLTVSNPSRSSITGHQAAYTGSGTPSYNADNYVYGKLERSINTTGVYDFPIGDAASGESYNPVRLDILQAQTGKATAKFTAGNPGSITVDTAINCSGTRSRIKYTAMTGEGYWNFTSSTGTTFNYDIYLHPNQNNTNTKPNENVTVGNTIYTATYRVLKATSGTAGGTWPAAAAFAGEPCNVSSNYYNMIGTNYSGFSDFAPGGGDGNTTALPVKLLSFDAKAVENSYILLDWKTATEIDNAGFDIERSRDGFNFSKIGFVQGSGNSSTVKQYRFEDRDLGNGGRFYYRLKQIDIDGHFEYSHIASAAVNSETATTVSLFPNPAHQQLQVNIYIGEPSVAVMKVVNVLGAEVLSNKQNLAAGANNISLSVSDLPSGSYLLFINTGTQVIERKFVKSSL